MTGGRGIDRAYTILRVAIRDGLGLRGPIRSRREHLAAAMDWLVRAHDACERGGVARAYSLRWRRMHRARGWLPAYPETTGYIIPTFFDYAAQTGSVEHRDRAVAMARWESEVQLESGAVRGGTIEQPVSPAVFNTGQVIFGWVRAFRETGDVGFRESAWRAADFLAATQDPDGAWRRGRSRFARSGDNVYDARTAWGLLEAAQVTGQARHRDAALRGLDFAVSRQTPNGWFTDCCLDDDRRPLLHTLAYTMEGLLEAGLLEKEERYVEAARRAADELLGRMRRDGSLAGRFDAAWKPAVRWSCLTGDAQMAVVWLRLYEAMGAERHLEAARRMNRYLMSTQDLDAWDPGVRGGIKGSQPIFGAYGPWEYPNWAAKFFVDALLIEERIAGEGSRPDPAS